MGRVCLTAASVVLLLSGCGGSGGGGGSGGAPTPTPAPAPTPTPTPTPQATLSYLHVFSIVPGDGAQPRGPLLQASDGNFYGTTGAGGDHVCRPPDNVPCGTVFRITPAGVETVIHSFGASPTDGYSPSAPLIQGNDGALYGVTANGGAHGGGSIFRITLSGSYAVLYSFGASAEDGLTPIGGLVEASDGNFYGATASGGANHCVQIPQSGGNCGTLFRMTPAGEASVIHSFGASLSDGIQPNGSLLQGSDGNIYGTTSNGGANSCTITGGPDKCGTVFKMTLGGEVTILHSFGNGWSSSFLSADGVAPNGGLVQGADGALYGSTLAGGTGRCGGFFGCGTVFRITTSGQIATLYQFATESAADGYGPSPLILAADGNFYGTTTSGGAAGADSAGTVFRLTPTGVKTILYSFGPVNTNPSAPLGVIQGADGALYGTTFYNGQLGAVGARGGSGTVFKLTAQ